MKVQAPAKMGAREHGRLGLLGALILVAVAWLFMADVRSPSGDALAAQVQVLNRADLTVLADAPEVPVTVSLPYVWDRERPGESGWAVFQMSFHIDEVPYGTYGLYIPRVGNAYQVVLNNTLLINKGDVHAPGNDDFGKLPQYMLVAPDALLPNNQLSIKVRADVSRQAGLSSLVIGPDVQVAQMYGRDMFWRQTGALMVITFSLFVGALAAALWWTSPAQTGPLWWERRSLYLYAALAQLCWVIGQIDYLVEHPWPNWPWWGLITNLARTLWGSFLGLFCIALADWERTLLMRRYVWCTLLVAVWCVVASWRLYAHGAPLTLQAWYLAYALCCTVFVVCFAWRARRAPVLFHRLMLWVIALNLLAALHDVLSFRMADAYAAIPYVRYTSTLFGLVILLVVVRQFQLAQQQARDLNLTLAARVAEKEQALALSYHKLERLAREQARTAERSRILRDMHDGVGAHLSAAIRQVQSGRVSQEDILGSLRESMEQLKLSIDAINLSPGDVSTLLANLRYRLTPRFAASDLQLHWDVALIAPLPYLDSSATRHLQFMVYEGLSNVFQHARASSLHITLRAQGEGVLLRMEDNGVGFDVPDLDAAALAAPGARAGKGLRSLAMRAGMIGATLHIHSQVGCTRLEIRLHRPATERRHTAREASPAQP